MKKRIRKKVMEYLRREPRFRERKNKDRGIANLLIKKFPILASIEKQTLVAVIQDASTMDRSWRKILKDDPSLRGSDYGRKKKLERDARLDLGYKS